MSSTDPSTMASQTTRSPRVVPKNDEASLESLEARLEQRWLEATGRIEELTQEVNELMELSGWSGDPAKRPTWVPEVSIVVPCYNEVATVGEVIERLLALPLDAEVIVVDDASTDGTGEVLHWLEGTPRLHVIPKPINQGKGAALQTGFQQAIGSIVVVHDADLEYEPEVIPHLLEPIRGGDVDVVYGSRFLESDQCDARGWHRWGNRLLTTASNLMTGFQLTDMETCQKAFRRRLLLGMDLEQKRFGFEPEFTARLAYQGASITELPIPYQPRGYAEGKKIGFRDLLSTLWCILRYSIPR